MNAKHVLATLKSLGTEQTRKTYARHGVQPPMFGVRYGDLYKLVKQIGTDHALALELWKTGNHDARTVATMIADPDKMTLAQLDQWAKTASSQLSLDAIALLAMKTSFARKCFEKWIKSKHEWTAAAGWHILAGGCCGRPGQPPSDIEQIPESQIEQYLKYIEENIHSSQNRVRHSMNGALIAIGLRSPALQKKAIAAAKRIGTVDVDHGDTSCVTPDAAGYILKAAGRKKKTSSKKKKIPATARSKKSVTKKVAARKKGSTAQAKKATRKKAKKR